MSSTSPVRIHSAAILISSTLIAKCKVSIPPPDPIAEFVPQYLAKAILKFCTAYLKIQLTRSMRAIIALSMSFPIIRDTAFRSMSDIIGNDVV